MNLTAILPGIVAVLYFITAISYLFKRDYAWALVWFSYSLANIGLIIAGNK
jgi:hypothetical protein